MFEMTWRNKYIPVPDNPTLPDLIAALEAAAGELREMQAAGVVLIGGHDDYYDLSTDSASVAEAFGFVPRDD
jgi:hypothetical protein